MTKEIYLAGGCFWGMEAYFKRIEGILMTEVGYANGNCENPTYEEVCSQVTGFAETLKIEYDDEVISLSTILTYYFRVIDPVSVNRQGGDIGNNYRTGIYYTDAKDIDIIKSKIAEVQREYLKKLAVEFTELKNFYPAEEYHQDFLEKNPSGYCHINLNKAEIPVIPEEKYKRLDDSELKEKLTPEEYGVMVHGNTEPPFRNKYDNHFEEGIYVDASSGEPLFSSRDKFDSGCGWPAFSKPIAPEIVKERVDTSLGMVREEVSARVSGGHLGHVFNDGPREFGGLRYCINSASLKFVPKEEMDKEGLGYLKGEL